LVPPGNRLRIRPGEYEDHRHGTCEGFEKTMYRSL